ncbi:MAG: cyclic nucleotide-binding domain-containing protein [Xanthobacteraceae bacterium]|nr:cyclic nucleotide-binding domain-containing protein [Xanthobacteraceae bacterium]
MTWVNLAGYAASLLVFATFCMRTMVPLRVAAIGSNLCFIVYGAAAGIYPVLVLHVVLLPLNGWRTLQMLQMTRKIARAARGDQSLDALKPYMHAQRRRKDDVIFRKNDHADNMYLVTKGELIVDELGFVLREGDLFGEIGMFSKARTRTFTVRCLDEVMVQSISRDDVARITFQNPAIAFHLLTLITNRLVDDLARMEAARTG